LWTIEKKVNGGRVDHNSEIRIKERGNKMCYA